MNFNIIEYFLCFISLSNSSLVLILHIWFSFLGPNIFIKISLSKTSNFWIVVSFSTHVSVGVCHCWSHDRSVQFQSQFTEFKFGRIQIGLMTSVQFQSQLTEFKFGRIQIGLMTAVYNFNQSLQNSNLDDFKLVSWQLCTISITAYRIQIWMNSNWSHDSSVQFQSQITEFKFGRIQIGLMTALYNFNHSLQNSNLDEFKLVSWQLCTVSIGAYRIQIWRKYSKLEKRARDNHKVHHPLCVYN